MNNEIREIEISVKELEGKIELAKALDRLHKNKDFKKVILDLFLTDRAIQLARGTSQAVMNDKSELIHKNALLAISGLVGFFHGIYREGEEAHAALEDARQEIMEEVINE